MAVNSCRAIVGQQLTASRVGTVSCIAHCTIYVVYSRVLVLMVWMDVCVVRCSRRRSLVQRVQASGASLDVIKVCIVIVTVFVIVVVVGSRRARWLRQVLLPDCLLNNTCI